MDPVAFPPRYRSGQNYTVEARAFGLVSLGRQEINPTMTEDGPVKTFVDNGRGLSGPLGLMKHFHHTMTLQPSGAESTVLTDELEWDGGQAEPYLKTAIAIDELRQRARELRCRGVSIGARQPAARDAIARHLDEKVGTAGGPITREQRAAWVAAFRDIERAATNVVR